MSRQKGAFAVYRTPETGADSTEEKTVTSSASGVTTGVVDAPEVRTPEETLALLDMTAKFWVALIAAAQEKQLSDQDQRGVALALSKMSGRYLEVKNMPNRSFLATNEDADARRFIIVKLKRKWYNIGTLYSVQKSSLEDTGGGEGVEVLRNEPFKNVPLSNGRYTAGQYTKKVHSVASKVNPLVRSLMPNDWLMAVEECFNAFPYMLIVSTFKNQALGNDSKLRIETMHLPDRGTTQNALALDPDTLGLSKINRSHENEVVQSETWSPARQLDGDVRAIYVRLQGADRGVQSNRTLRSRIENSLVEDCTRLMRRYNRQVFCWTDEWWGRTIADIRRYEQEVASKLHQVPGLRETWTAL